MTVVRVPGWGLSYSEARYYGWRHSLHVGPWLFFWGKMTDAELEADHAARVAGQVEGMG
jgi:hypothetical protein